MDWLDSGQKRWKALLPFLQQIPRMRLLMGGALAVGFLGAYGAYYQYRASTNLEALWSRRAHALHTLGRLENHAYRMALEATGVAVAGSYRAEPAGRESAVLASARRRDLQEFEQAWREVEKLLAEYAELAQYTELGESPGRVGLSQQLALAAGKLRQAALQLAGAESNTSGIVASKQRLQQAVQEFETIARRTTEAEWSLYRELQQQARGGALQEQIILYATGMAATVLACLLGFLFSKQQRDAALEAGRLKGRFLANMSHEIRTPMNVIIGLTELVLDSPLQPGQQRHLSMVKSSAESLLTLINDILDFSKIEAGRLDLELVEFNLVETLSEATRGLSVRARQKGLKLICNVHPAIPEMLVGDPVRLKQVIINLVSNAIRFTEEGYVRVRTRLQAETESEVLVHFAVSDSGVGIPLGQQDKIFDSFAQVDSSVSRRHGGTGLGLAICRQLVRLMGGEIKVQSQPGEGSTFFFEVRFGRPQPKPPPAVAPDLRGARALLLDRDAASRHLLAAMLDTWRVETAVADSCPVASEVINLSTKLGRPFSLLLLSVETIETGGDELLERMRTSPDLRAVPLILVAEQEPTVERLSRFPSAHWLVKPISQSQFLETVESALGRGSAGSFPSLQQAPAAPVVLPSATGRDSLLRVLLVEDIVENQLLTSELLRQRGHSIVVASHGREALQAFEQQRFDVVLMDIQMPEMGGVEATLLIRQREKETGASRTPIIAVTAHAIKGDRGRYLKAGMDGYVSKPIRRQQLYDEIDSLVGPGSASASAPARGQGPGVSVL